ncbi:MAG: leucine-rich repeat protein [Spirochaetes bacterium]|nr:leucine-rich repeat protein [Spirochaetota bacterium]
MKKILLFTIFALTFAATAFTQNASDFTVDAKGVITKYTGFDTVVVIPATIDGKKITAIGDGAFRKADLTRVTIPEGVTTIGNSAFLDNKLTSITIPNSVTLIDESAFKNNRLTSVTIPGSVKTISRDAFRGNTSLATIVIPEGVEEIYSGAFADTKCTSVTLPSTITFLSDTYTGNPFDNSGKPSFTLAANIKADFDSIPAFYSYIANDRKAGTYASNLPLTSKKADDYEYYETRYGAVLTAYTGNSTRVRIPATIGGVAVKALYGMKGGFDFYGVLQSKNLAAVQIPEGITYIGNSVFAKNELANVTIPDSVTYIGSEAFSNNQLTSVTIGTGVISIDSAAFNKNKLTSITIPNNVTSIGYSAFNENKLTSVTIGSNVTLMRYDSEYSDRTRYDVFDHYTRGYGSSLDVFYNNNKKAAGTYIKIPGLSKWVSQQFPSSFLGKWKRDNFKNTLTITANTLKDNNDDDDYYGWYIQGISGDVYTIINQNNYDTTITIKLVNGNLVISGYSYGSGENNLNGTWKKQQSTTQSTQSSTTQQSTVSLETPVLNGFVLINSGTVTVGSPDNEPGRVRGDSNEDQRQYKLTSFYISIYEVTQKEYQEVMGKNPSKFKGDNFPVENVSWLNAIEYCNKRSQKEGLTPVYTVSGSNVTLNDSADGYRLPTLAQWEYACRAGTTTAFNNGNNDYTKAALVGEVGWYKGNAGRKTHEVGLKLANTWGLYDMHGNVSEWCWNTTEDKSEAAYKGGSWNSSAQSLRSASYGLKSITGTDSEIGFRIIRK